MNPIAIAALHGLIKGYAFKAPPTADPITQNFIGPLKEELLFRAMPGASAPGWATAAPFALAHLKPGMDADWALFRTADAFAGGLLYHAAYKQFGIFGSWAAHALHNIMVGVGSGLNEPALPKRK